MDDTRSRSNGPTLVVEDPESFGNMGEQYGVDRVRGGAAERSVRVRAGARRRRQRTQRTLVASDLLGLALAFLLARLLVGDHPPEPGDLVFVLVLPPWVVAATLLGLYGVDAQRTDHTTADDVIRVLELLTLGTWLALVLAWTRGDAPADLGVPIAFWGLALGIVVLGRVVTRAVGRRAFALQRAVIVGAGDVGQLAARKIRQHPEYGISLLGFVDANPRERRPDLESIEVLGSTDRLVSIVRSLDVDRVFFAFSEDSPRETIELLRSLRDLDVRVDIVPRLYEVVGPGAVVDHLESLPLVGIPSLRLSRPALLAKRASDIVVAGLLLLATAPLFGLIALLIRLGSPGPVFFRQTRLGAGMKEFTNLKFRTMDVGTSQDEHRDFIRAAMRSAHGHGPQEGGLFKMSRTQHVTPIGRRLRKWSLDELPQLINVLRGDMSLVGPRPCIPYETETFKPHHFERFLVPAGLTGLWQVTARARATFAEALEMDVAYVRGYSLALDLKILLQTPIELVRGNTTT